MRKREAGPATMTSRAEVGTKMRRSKIQKGGDAGRVKSDLGGTCHNDKPGLDDGDDGGVGMRVV